MTKNSQPLISIITASFNSSDTIKDTIESVLNQTYKNIEYIIIDGQSKDDTVEVIKSYVPKFIEKGIIYKWISEKDSGIYDAWNKALKIATGDWLSFIGSDDYFKTATLFNELVPFLDKAITEKTYFVYGKVEHICSDDKLIETSGDSWVNKKNEFTNAMNLPHSGSLNYKELFLKNGNFDDRFKIAGDYEFLLREYKKPENNAVFIDKVFTVMREGGVSASLDNRLLVIKENHLARKLNDISDFSIELFIWELRVRMIFFLKRIFGRSFALKLADLYRKIILGKKKRWSA